MEAAHESGLQGGAPVQIADVIAQAQARVARRLGVSQLDLP